jgi:leucine dehydrogenase
VVNAGGLINVYNELVPGGYNEERAVSEMDKIYTNLKDIFAIAKDRGICTSRAANLFGDRRVDAARALI